MLKVLSEGGKIGLVCDMEEGVVAAFWGGDDCQYGYIMNNRYKLADKFIYYEIMLKYVNKIY